MRTTTDRRRNVQRAALAAVVAALSMVAAPAAQAGGQQAWELDQGRGREVAIGNLGTYPGIIVLPGSQYGTEQWDARELTAEDAGVDHFKDGQLGSGDVDGDGDGDMVVTAPHAASTTLVADRGKVIVVPGAPDGPDMANAYGIENPDADRSLFGARLAVSDLDRDGLQDVATTSVGEDGTKVTVLWGNSGAAMSTADATTFDPPEGSVFSLTAGNVDGDARRELAVVYAGRPQTARLSAVEGRIVLCDVNAEREVDCGGAKKTAAGVTAVAVGNAVGSAIDDVVVGQARRSDGTGRLLVYRGTRSGLAAPVSVTQDTPGVPGTSQQGDRFGAALALADMNGDGKADAAIGAPRDAKGGRVTVLYGATDGFGKAGAATVDQDTAGILGRDELGDAFGAAVSLLDVDGSGRRDLIIGAPGEDDEFGSVTIIRSKVDGKPNPEQSERVEPEDIGIENPACCGTLALGNRIGQ